ncbi:uncharacterized protein Dwil_GK23763 [Drosophila willistoni]|uniref:tRNA pseudouridine(55) synthase n=1 Tax=Drosophila willistoni TaxID=7260 RepID=B4MTU8_DROWI|nr:putative tRNA pseudouridine synthase Pus10 [Drosophila willistoni]EDW75537.2 uncharacterized protein Dwil_GK23763 [Drosophila willistoni]
MKNQELVDYLSSFGVCRICQLRYLKARGSEYRDVKKTFQKLEVTVDDLDNDDDDELKQEPVKKPRLANCSLCLGLFSDSFQQDLISRILSSDFAKYENQSIVLAISMPLTLQIRQLSMWFALQRKFGSPPIDQNSSPDVPIKEAVKLILHPIICKQLGKEYDANGLMINIELKHMVEKDEVDKLTKLQQEAFPPHRNQKRIEISRGLLEKQYQPSRIKLELFEKYFTIPPTTEAEPLQLESITLTGPIVCVAGRYRKLSRELSHTPWVLNGQRQMEDSIEEIIIRNISQHFTEEQGNITFMSSGREDVDVRCLGNGRPFVLEIPNALRLSLSKQVAYEMEQSVDKSNKVSIRDLQVVPRDQITYIKTGEEQKKKHYRALCALKEPVTLEILEKLQISEPFDIQQKTPIRVLHRRPLHTRPRTIYSLRARVQRDNLKSLVIDIVTQAGTYVKELVHGEFGRTNPSISSIIGKPIDILALDVESIELDWPPQVNNAVEN